MPPPQWKPQNRHWREIRQLYQTVRWVVKTFASVDKSVQFVNVTCGPSWSGLAYIHHAAWPWQLNGRPLQCNLHSCRVLGEDVVRNPYTVYNCLCAAFQWSADIRWKLTGDGYPKCLNAVDTLNVLWGWSRVYFKRGVQPKCGVQTEKCGVQDWKMWSPK